ncbi:hypothetical protein SAMN06265373_101588 [Shimia sagamensis]|uniref:Uncharacterized protein n=1 Tax=Shimia sagamensis TaxID=1566352 RepID=A0ABY1NBS8_9RHOB|nr:hypothetical protein SAMN06265373_101588 [Shimia sagamensis]
MVFPTFIRPLSGKCGQKTNILTACVNIFSQASFELQSAFLSFGDLLNRHLGGKKSR